MIELGEIYAEENAQLATGIPIREMEVGLFDGALTSIPQGIQHTFNIARSASLHSAAPLDDVTSDSMNEWLDTQRKNANQAMRDSRTDPRTTGTVGQLFHGVSSVVTMGVMGGVAMGPVGAVGAIGGLSMYDKATELMDQGVDLETAQKVGAVTGAVMGVGAALPPFLGGTLGKQIASGIGINVGLGVGERAASAAILEEKYAGIAEHYNALDGTAIAIDAILGAAFPLGARLMNRPSIAQTDDALAANRVTVEQSRDPALQATLEGIDRKLTVDMEVTRQIMEEGRPLAEIEIPQNVMDDVVPNRAVGEAAAAAAKAIDDLMMQENGRDVGTIEADIATLTRAFNPERVEPEVKAPDLSQPAPKTDVETEVTPDQFTKQAARSIIDTDPNLKVVDENGREMVAKDLLDQAEVRFKQEKQEASLFKVAIACAIGVGE